MSAIGKGRGICGSASNVDTGSCERSFLLKRAEVSANLPGTSTYGLAPISAILRTTDPHR
jgi:hypothetical protein